MRTMLSPLLVLLAICLLPGLAMSADSRLPNIAFVMADDLERSMS